MADSVNNIALTVTSSRHLTEEQKVKLRKATKEFESIFVQMMLKSMRGAQGTDESNEFGGESYGGDVMKGLFDTELSKHIGGQGKFGIAESLYKKLTGESLHAVTAAQAASIAKRAAAIQTADGMKATTLAAEHTSTPAKIAVQQSGKTADNTNRLAGQGRTRLQETSDIQSAPTSVRLEPQQQNGLPPGFQPDAVQSAAPVTMISAQLAADAAARQSATDASKTTAVGSQGSAASKRVPRVSAGTALERIKSYNEIIAHAADTVGVDANLLKAMIVEESGGKQHARSSRNAKGLMQLIDSTAQSMGVKNVWDPHQNIQGGARYLKQQLDKFDGDVSLALASYNAGPGNVERYKGIPPFQETRNYVKRVMNLFTAFQNLERNSDDVIK
ncbi:MAG TPA: transglycosylase SLT domain-containing protein [Bacteroidota bacterium]|nr:transglycosylase SLT domain-containing protein [Bacteroidota bacterium]